MGRTSSAATTLCAILVLYSGVACQSQRPSAVSTAAAPAETATIIGSPTAPANAASQLIVTQQAFWIADSDRQRLGYVFQVESHNADNVVIEGLYAVRFMARDGSIVARAEGDIGAVLPGGATAIADSAQFSGPVDRMVVTLYSGEEAPPAGVRPIVAVPGTYDAGSATARGTITNPYDVPLHAEPVVATLFDAQDHLLAGGLTLSELPAAGHAAVEVHMTGVPDTIVRAILYPRQPSTSP